MNSAPYGVRRQDAPGREIDSSPGRDGWEALYVGYYSRLLSYAVMLVRDRATAEDVVQDAFMMLLTRWPALDRPERELAYLFAVVRNAAKSALRRQPPVRRSPFAASPTAEWSFQHGFHQMSRIRCRLP